MSSILSFANTSVDDWFGFKRHIFDFEGYEAWLVEPEKKAPGMPWTWCMEWPSAFVKRIGVPDLLARGFHQVHIKVPGYACDEALRVFRRYHDFLHSLGLAEQGKKENIRRMNETQKHIQASLVRVLKHDSRIRKDAFNEAFTPEVFGDVLFSLMLAALLREEYDPAPVLEVLRRTVY